MPAKVVKSVSKNMEPMPRSPKFTAVLYSQSGIGFVVLALSLLLLFPYPVQTAGIADIKDIRMWHAPERSRIVFDMDKGTNFKVFTLGNPDRVVIDLPDTRLKTTIPGPSKTGQFISQIRAGNPDNNTLRLVFDVEKPVRYFIQLLKPVDNYQYRLVVDYYHQDAVVESDLPAQAVITRPKPKPPRRDGDILVLIDAGHGGEDPGALGKTSREKDVVLAIAKRLKNQIDRTPGLKAVLTRTGDYYISLRRRTRIAREEQADIFISIHADAFKNSKARGASVYALSQRGASSETARWLANKENSSDLVGGVSLADKDNLLAGVLLDLSMSKTVSESISFGREVLEELQKIGPVHSKRVEQAGFVVLKSPDIPSILIETAYITNPVEEKQLKTPVHQEKIASAVVRGIQRYLAKSGGIYAN